MQRLLAAATNPFGSISPPGALSQYGSKPDVAIGNLINRFLQLLIVGAVIYALFNLVIAGYDFMAAGDDAKKVAGAWAKIWQTILGVAISAGAFVIAAVFGQIIFGDPMFILKPTIPGP